MMRMSVPLSSRWVAKLCRSVCTVTRLPRPDAAHAERQAACSTVGMDRMLAITAGKQPVRAAAPAANRRAGCRAAAATA